MQGILFRCFFFFLVLAATEFVLSANAKCIAKGNKCGQSSQCCKGYRCFKLAEIIKTSLISKIIDFKFSKTSADGTPRVQPYFVLSAEVSRPQRDPQWTRQKPFVPSAEIPKISNFSKIIMQNLLFCPVRGGHLDRTGLDEVSRLQ
uniref:Prokineticin domain-containing protein n=1 Tax=Strigamia maritima TaxID=126957 RepID=T1ILJ4_STRMM